MWVCRDSRVSGARGAAPCCGKAAISERGESSLCGDKPSAERTRPQGCISAPFVPKGLFRVPVLGSFFKNSCAGSLVKASRKKAFASSSGMAISSGTRLSMKPPRLQSLWFLALRSSTDNFCLMIFSRFFKLPDFLLAFLNLGGQFLAGFLSRFRHGWSLLSARRHGKRAVDFLGCPCGYK